MGNLQLFGNFFSIPCFPRWLEAGVRRGARASGGDIEGPDCGVARFLYRKRRERQRDLRVWKRRRYLWGLVHSRRFILSAGAVSVAEAKAARTCHSPTLFRFPRQPENVERRKREKQERLCSFLFNRRHPPLFILLLLLHCLWLSISKADDKHCALHLCVFVVDRVTWRRMAKTFLCVCVCARVCLCVVSTISIGFSTNSIRTFNYRTFPFCPLDSLSVYLMWKLIC